MKTLLTNAPVLAFYDPNAEANILVDASSHGLGTILTQKQQGEFKPIAYGSRALRWNCDKAKLKGSPGCNLGLSPFSLLCAQFSIYSHHRP